MSPDTTSESDHTYQVYLAHDEVSFPYSFTLPKTATVQQLEQMLCAFGNLTDLIQEGKGIFIFKYDMVPSNPERCFRSILPWLCNQSVPENVMESGKQLKEYFPEGSTSELKASDVIHIVAVTRSSEALVRGLSLHFAHCGKFSAQGASHKPNALIIKYFLETYAQRQETIKALYEQVVNVHGKGVVVVRRFLDLTLDD
ncbi:hypothetical protein QCA50_013519 [Cerrena zonata]|uniref:Uncharacterized protein n=1 Tax=Cerrena zonata TaxID=2478898 RepID=A0AAW0FT28_9APHY